MRAFFLSSIALAAFLSFLPAASADDAAERSAAIALCRGEISRQAGVEEADVRLDQVRARARQVRVDLDLWRNGDLTNVRCTVTREGEAQAIASIDPALETATAAR